MPLFKKKPKVKPWTPATEYKLVKLKRAGPKEDQSTDAYLYGKALGDKQNKFRSTDSYEKNSSRRSS